LTPLILLAVALAACAPSARVAPSSATPWTPPEPLAHYMPPPDEGRAPTGVVPEADRVYDLVDLIDLAERTNPRTRLAWEQARAAAARLGIAEAAYLPTLVLLATGGWAQEVNSTPSGTEVIRPGRGLRRGAELPCLRREPGACHRGRGHARSGGGAARGR
jgi:outer membrane protein TolC